MLVRVLTLAVLLSLNATAGFAQQNDPRRDQGDVACGADARRVCRKVIDQGDFAVLKCFQDNRDKLSNACRRFLTDMGQLN